MSTSSAYKSLVFVYGTLRSGASNHWRMKDSRFLGHATARGQLFQIDWYPGAIFAPNDPNQIVGEIYDVPDSVLGELDQFEGQEYERVRVTAKVDDRYEQAWAWNYRLPIDEQKRIPSGDWLTVK
jgi:gamma-glutamylcyclotransferase (GGCT)/AIG2-like uncharacterized protein YtfP